MQEPLLSAYSNTENSICLGGIMYQNKVSAPLHISLQSINRHGLIAGATGTGKTKTIQMLSEQLANAGVSVLLMDIKGDISGIAKPAIPEEVLLERQQALGLPFTPTGYSTEFLAFGKEKGVPVRATLENIGPLLFAKMLRLNETQSSIVSVLFQYAKENQLLLLDLADFKKLLQFAQIQGKEAIESQYGGLATTSLKAILRALLELESQGGDAYLGEPAFDVQDLLQKDKQGKGLLFVLRLLHIQDKPALFSSFMLGLLDSVYKNFPEMGDADKPKLVIFLDEAHLLFQNASKALLEQLEQTVKLIRSKGVGLFFCTQSPNDIPAPILGQLGLKIQHALRAFTAKDRKAIKLIAENFPLSERYDTVSLLTTLGTGKALLSALDTKGQPTPLVEVLIRAPCSRMGPLTETELSQCLEYSSLFHKYAIRLERESAKKILQTRMISQKSVNKKPSLIETLSKNTLFRQIVLSIWREIIKAITAMFKVGNRRNNK